MYSGTTLTPLSGRLLGAHQKIDRLAWASLRDMAKTGTGFPRLRLLLHFEGINGPDAIKRKSPSKDEPWHYYEPFSRKNQDLIEILSDHYDRLVHALRKQDEVRAAFEAAWLAHAIVDGLTPAHHFPYEERLVELRGGKSIKSRTTVREKIVMPGASISELLKNNWGMWGPKGLLTTHGLFEWGVAAIIAPLTTKRVKLRPEDIQELYDYGVIGLFKRKAKEIAGMQLYEHYQHRGWTPGLARQVKLHLVPVIVRNVALAWYAALIESGSIEKQ
ncbi:MAG TPA: hypothetical protein VGS08_01765 [Candidatus Saccharimonadales bacterium]|nr:hypothetical protein [Candidatus Saccharimonadales bacterium]